MQVIQYQNKKSITRKKFLFDLHAHTAESSNCAAAAGAELVRAYVAAGYHGAVITDHYSRAYTTVYKSKTPPEEFLFKGYRAAKEEGKKWGFTVLPGMELKFVDSPNEFLIIGADENWLKDKKNLFEMGLAAFYKRYSPEVLVIQAHPFRRICSPADPAFIDGIEVANGNAGHDNYNSLAYGMWLRNLSLIPTAATDAHSIKEVGTAGVYFYDKVPASPAELMEMLKKRQYQLAGTKGLLHQKGVVKAGTM